MKVYIICEHIDWLSDEIRALEDIKIFADQNEAQKFCDENNEKQLQIERSYFDEFEEHRKQRHLENQALIEAGLREGEICPYVKREFKKPTKLDDEFYVKEVEVLD